MNRPSRGQRPALLRRRVGYAAASLGVVVGLAPILASFESEPSRPIVVDQWDWNRRVVHTVACLPETTIPGDGATPYRDAGPPPTMHACSGAS